MGRMVIIALLALAAYRLMTGRWPWEKRPSAVTRKLGRARGLLGVGAKAQRTEILAAHRRTLAAVHPDKGGSAVQVHEANEARDLLLAQLPRDSVSDPKEPI